MFCLRACAYRLQSNSKTIPRNNRIPISQTTANGIKLVPGMPKAHIDSLRVQGVYLMQKKRERGKCRYFLVQGNQLDLKGKAGVGGNRDLCIWETLLAVGVLGLNDNLGLLATGHAQHGIVPSGDHTSSTDSETERVALLLCVVIGIEHGAVVKVSSVENSDYYFRDN